MKDWYHIENSEVVDSPALVIYPARVQQNINLLKTYVPELNRLRPHVKTHKSGEVSSLLIKAGITKFKCATIAEAEMLATAGAADVLLAYQPVGPKALRLLSLVEKFPNTKFSCLVDNIASATWLSAVFAKKYRSVFFFIDLNIGMNRTGVAPDKAIGLYDECRALPNVTVVGLHAYDGHLRDTDFGVRTEKCNEGFEPVMKLAQALEKRQSDPIVIIAGGTPTFPIHAKRSNVECSPGTFIYWDYGYKHTLTEQPWLFAALVLTRVISKPSPDTLCLDLGHKSIASENPIHQRVHFLNAPDLQASGHSEEHMVVKTAHADLFQVGDVLYGVPYHVCPTCALYDAATVVEEHHAVAAWNILSRKKMITL